MNALPLPRALLRIATLRISKEPLPLRADEQVGCLGAQGMQGGHQVLQAACSETRRKREFPPPTHLSNFGVGCRSRAEWHAALAAAPSDSRSTDAHRRRLQASPWRRLQASRTRR
jgi:hypothetical protein